MRWCIILSFIIIGSTRVASRRRRGGSRRIVTDRRGGDSCRRDRALGRQNPVLVTRVQRVEDVTRGRHRDSVGNANAQRPTGWCAFFHRHQRKFLRVAGRATRRDGRSRRRSGHAMACVATRERAIGCGRKCVVRFRRVSRAKRVATLVARRDRVAPFAPIWCTRWRGDGRNPVTRRHRRASRHRDHAVNASQKYSPSDFSRFPRGAVPATDSTASTIERFAQRCAKGIACDYSTRSHCLQTPRVI